MTEPVKIEKAAWLDGVFARTRSFTDLLRQPVKNYGLLSPTEKKGFRQTQLEKDELIRILGHYDEHSLAMKFDGTLGWVEKKDYVLTPEVRQFASLPQGTVPASQFLDSWKGVPYLWGGLSREGIDCSGFTQLYFLQVHRKLLPKNSRDQRKSGTTIELQALRNDDLVFGHRKGSKFHHVAIFRDEAFWHARLKQGVVREEREAFLSGFVVEAVVRCLP